MIRVGVLGCAGRMGQMLVREVAADSEMTLSSGCEVPGVAAIGQDAGRLAGIGELGVTVGSDLAQLVEQSQTIIDFTTPNSTAQLAPKAAACGVALVVGTTGLNPEQSTALRAAAEQTAVVWAPNMSVGINVLLRLVAEATRLLGPDYDLEIVEAHHRHKKDAPSGTARRLAEVVAEASADRGSLQSRACYGRHGMGQRPATEIGIHTVRGGDIVGDHTVMYCGDGERLELTHKASSRQTFARGAVRAVRWVRGRAPGLYDMQDVLGLR